MSVMEVIFAAPAKRARRNLLTANMASIETNTTGLAVYDSTASIARSTSEASDGAACLRITCATASGDFYAGTTAAGTRVLPNLTYTAVLDVRRISAVGRNATVFLQWYDASQAAGTQPQGGLIACTTSFQQVTLTAVSPSNAAFATVGCIVKSGLLNDVVAIDRLGLFEGSSTLWTPGSG